MRTRRDHRRAVEAYRSAQRALEQGDSVALVYGRRAYPVRSVALPSGNGRVWQACIALVAFDGAHGGDALTSLCLGDETYTGPTAVHSYHHILTGDEARKALQHDVRWGQMIHGRPVYTITGYRNGCDIFCIPCIEQARNEGDISEYEPIMLADEADCTMSCEHCHAVIEHSYTADGARWLTEQRREWLDNNGLTDRARIYLAEQAKAERTKLEQTAPLLANGSVLTDQRTSADMAKMLGGELEAIAPANFALVQFDYPGVDRALTSDELDSDSALEYAEAYIDAIIEALDVLMWPHNLQVVRHPDYSNTVIVWPLERTE